MLPSPQQTAPGSSPKRQRRPRAIQACNLCRSKKYKCDGVSPCSHCRKRGLNCVYRVAPVTEKDAALHNRLRDLEKRLKQAEAENARLQASFDGLTAQTNTERSSAPEGLPIVSAYSSVTGVSPVPASIDHLSNGCQSDEEDPAHEDGTEIVEVNPLTKDIEFHGNTSSVAFLGRVGEEYGCTVEDSQGNSQMNGGTSLLGSLRNDTFASQRSDSVRWIDDAENRFFFPHSYLFLETYFNNLHYMHPFIDKGRFYSRCGDLWQGRAQEQSRSFLALYFSVASLGAVIRTWTEKEIDGMGRFEWSRMLFERAQLTLGNPGLTNDLETALAYFFMAKVCQNELNPNMAYTYLGMASRTLLSIGANRNTFLEGKWAVERPKALEASKTWWGLYSLEIELSFALGRPDSLGIDEYHNRPVPPMDGSEIDIIPAMMGIARIMRAISVKVYLHRLSLAQKLQSTLDIEAEMDTWVASLPEAIKPRFLTDVDRHCRLDDPPWAYVQRLVLQIRYYNVKMLLLRPFLVHAARHHDRSLSLEEAVNKCTDAAARTIELIYETYRVHTFFRTWWYNITYLTFAASIILFRAHQTIHHARKDHNYVELIEKTLNMLDIMNESVVACKTAKMLRQMLSVLSQRTERPSSREQTCVPDQTEGSYSTSANFPQQHVSPMDFGVAHLGLEELDGCLWDWRWDFGDIWENDDLQSMTAN